VASNVYSNNNIINIIIIIITHQSSVLTHSGDTCSRKLYQKLAPNRTQLYSVQVACTRNFQTQPTNKPHNFGHVHWCKFLVQACVTAITDRLQLMCKQTKPNPAQAKYAISTTIQTNDVKYARLDDGDVVFISVPD